jgi:hypothetical protein
MPEWETNSGEAIQTNQKMEKILQINDQKRGEHDPTNPTGFGQSSVKFLENGEQWEAIEEQSEKIIKYILKFISKLIGSKNAF